MSAEYLWRPVEPVPPPGGAIGPRLFAALCRWHGQSPDGETEVGLDTADVPWLQGFTCGSVNESDRVDAFALIAAITTHGHIVIEVTHR